MHARGMILHNLHINNPDPHETKRPMPKLSKRSLSFGSVPCYMHDHPARATRCRAICGVPDRHVYLHFLFGRRIVISCRGLVKNQNSTTLEGSPGDPSSQ